jgi:hypothetical protein
MKPRHPVLAQESKLRELLQSSRDERESDASNPAHSAAATRETNC